MAVYIKDIEMPKGDTGILLALYNGEVHLIGAELVHVGKGKGFEAVVVPEPHGRLIDADALEYGEAELNGHDELGDFEIVTREEIESAPTVIPSDH